MGTILFNILSLDSTAISNIFAFCSSSVPSYTIRSYTQKLATVNLENLTVSNSIKETDGRTDGQSVRPSVS